MFVYGFKEQRHYCPHLETLDTCDGLDSENITWLSKCCCNSLLRLYSNIAIDIVGHLCLIPYNPVPDSHSCMSQL